MCTNLEELCQGALAYAGGFDAGALSLEQATGVVHECSRMIASLGAVRDLAAARAAECRSSQPHGSRLSAEDLARDSGTSTASARRRIEHGQRLSKHPELGAAARSGALSPEQAAVVAEGVEVNPDKAEQLLEAAKHASLSELQDLVAREKARAGDVEERRRRIHARRSFRHYSDLEGGFNGRLYGPVEDGVLLFQALDQIRRRLAVLHANERPRFDALDYDAIMILGAALTGRSAELSLSDLLELGLFPQLDEDLLAKHCGRRAGNAPSTSPSSPPAPPPAPAAPPQPVRTSPSFAAPPAGPPAPPAGPPAPPAGPPAPATAAALPGSSGGDEAAPTRRADRGPKLFGSPVRILVRVDLDTLLRGVPADGEVCEIAGHGPVAVSVVKDLARNGNAFLVGVLTKSEQVLGVYHQRRRPSAKQSSALEYVYPSCAATGCNARVGLQQDHRVDWSRTHFTVFDLLDRLCPHHHRLKTEQNWALVEGRGKRAFVPPSDPRHPSRRGERRTGTDPPP